MKLTISFCVFILISLNIQSQCVITKGYSPSIIKQLFNNERVIISTMSFTGNSNALGYFTNSNTNLKLSKGIVLSTGDVNTIGNSNTSSYTSTDNHSPGSKLLNSLLNINSTFDAATIKFDFIPSFDSIEFNFVFASEEYPEFVGSKFNDVFGMFISGPGFDSIVNLAKLPNGDTISINNVNATKNSEYYIDNKDNPQIEFDGLTKRIKVGTKLQCGKKYHLEIVLADVDDASYDSGIFLEAQSFTSIGGMDNIKVTLDSLTSQSFCNNDQTFTLSNGKPVGGIYYINGIPSNIFNPKEALLGDNIISYSVQNNECLATASLNIQVDDCLDLNENELYKYQIYSENSDKFFSLNCNSPIQQISIYNLLGVKINEQNIDIQPIIKIKNMQAGYNIIKVIEKNGKETIRTIHFD